MTIVTIDELTKKVIGCAYAVHNALGAGFLEKVYENALRLELDAAGLRVRQQHPIPVHYRGQAVGDFFADLVVEDRLIVELKAVQNIAKEHEVQLVNYLAATAMDDGLLINFGSSVAVKRKFREYRKKQDYGNRQD
jgi:GxxExxY protein